MAVRPVVRWAAIRSKGSRTSVGSIRIYAADGQCRELLSLSDEELQTCIKILLSGHSWIDLDEGTLLPKFHAA
jgi:hypothetical protein